MVNIDFIGQKLNYNYNIHILIDESNNEWVFVLFLFALQGLFPDRPNNEK